MDEVTKKKTESLNYLNTDIGRLTFLEETIVKKKAKLRTLKGYFYFSFCNIFFSEGALLFKFRREIENLQNELISLKAKIKMDSKDARKTHVQNVKERELQIVLKTDVHGSMEAILPVLESMGSFKIKKPSLLPNQVLRDPTINIEQSNKIRVNILSKGVGEVTPKDIEILSNTNDKSNNISALVCFNLPSSNHSSLLPYSSNVNIHNNSLSNVRIPYVNHPVIYNIISDVKGIISKMIDPYHCLQIIGEAEVLNLFPIKNPKDVVLGCRVKSGQLVRGSLHNLELQTSNSSHGKLKKTLIYGYNFYRK